MDTTNRFERELLLLGQQAFVRLRCSHVAVFGIGGVGSWAAEALARAGVGEITLVDDDYVDVTNINRQLIALGSTIGMPKTEVMAQRIRDIDYSILAHPIHERYTIFDRERFFLDKYDYIIDAIDSVACKVDLIVTAHEKGIPIISAMGAGNKLGRMPFEVADINKTSVCPLARVLRQELKKKGLKNHDVVYSREQPIELPEKDGERVISSASWVTPIAGFTIAGEVIRRLCDQK